LFSACRQILGELSEQPQKEQLDQLLALIGDQVLGTDLTQWQGMTASDLERWLDSNDGELPPMLKIMDGLLGRSGYGDEAVELMQDKQIIQIADSLALEWRNGTILERQEWCQRPLETGAFSYHQNHRLLQGMKATGVNPVVIRMVARILDLIELLDLMRGNDVGEDRFGSLQLAEAEGLGWVKTARGLLMHHVMMEDGKVRQYRIAAPTEWNFHPTGALYRSLHNWTKIEPQQLPLWVDLQVLSLDPCVQYKVDINHA
ncbi:MAG: nickel-dependent hydrogenase large subunit, partial [Motiliproteus sp.]|nr:nickel-dependent hydrogenase large subunit [Motiliproteus sp.]